MEKVAMVDRMLQPLKGYVSDEYFKYLRKSELLELACYHYHEKTKPVIIPVFENKSRPHEQTGVKCVRVIPSCLDRCDEIEGCKKCKFDFNKPLRKKVKITYHKI